MEQVNAQVDAQVESDFQVSAPIFSDTTSTQMVHTIISERHNTGDAGKPKSSVLTLSADILELDKGHISATKKEFDNARIEDLKDSGLLDQIPSLITGLAALSKNSAVPVAVAAHVTIESKLKEIFDKARQAQVFNDKLKYETIQQNNIDAALKLWMFQLDFMKANNLTKIFDLKLTELVNHPELAYEGIMQLNDIIMTYNPFCAYGIRSKIDKNVFPQLANLLSTLTFADTGVIQSYKGKNVKQPWRYQMLWKYLYSQDCATNHIYKSRKNQVQAVVSKLDSAQVSETDIDTMFSTGTAWQTTKYALSHLNPLSYATGSIFLNKWNSTCKNEAKNHLKTSGGRVLLKNMLEQWLKNNP